MKDLINPKINIQVKYARLINCVENLNDSDMREAKPKVKNATADSC